MVTAFAVAPSTAELQASQRLVTEPLLLPRVELAQSEAALFIREERVQRGDSIASLLARMGVDDDQLLQFLRQEPRTLPLFQQLRPGKWITAKTDSAGALYSLVFPLNANDRAIVVERRDGALHAAEQTLQLETRVSMKSGEVHSTLFAATDDAGLPDNVAVQLADIFGSEIDFHRDLRHGDRFSVVFETIYHQGQPLRAGRVLAAEFVNHGQSHRAVYFELADGRGSYYTPEGKSLKKAFLRSPIEFSRISSGFTMRFHPILQEWRTHKGVDYAAPSGTRVKATAEGIVEFAGRQNGYGNVIVLRHQGKYTTYYGHLNGFAAGIKKGTRVSQGDVIGYVGMTGWATGPHLHYEFRINNVQQNPLSTALPTQLPLTANQLAQFEHQAGPLLARLELVRSEVLAQLD